VEGTEIESGDEQLSDDDDYSSSGDDLFGDDGDVEDDEESSQFWKTNGIIQSYVRQKYTQSTNT
jgi:hypothetical protein